MLNHLCTNAIAVIAILSSLPAYSEDTLKLNGYIMLDHDYHGPFYTKESDKYYHKTEIRRSKIGIKYKFSEYLSSDLELKYAREFDESDEFLDSEGLKLGDALIRFENDNQLGFQFGKMKEPFSLEQQTGSADLLIIERSIATSSFSPGRSFGVQLDHKKKKHTLTLGYFIDRDTEHDFALSNFNLLQQDQNNDIKAVTLRFTFTPVLNKESSIHIGTSLSKRWLNERKVQIKENGEVNAADNIIRSARFYADDSKHYQFELAWHNKNILLQSEIFSTITQQTDGKSWSYSGAYLQASYRNSGNYRYKKGKYKSPTKHLQGFSELVFRQSVINLRNNNVGSEAAFTVVGANYYPTESIKLMANIIFPSMTGDAINKDQSGKALSLRAQFKF
jgi:phosphate-selective porin OprO/OprP